MRVSEREGLGHTDKVENDDERAPKEKYNVQSEDLFD